MLHKGLGLLTVLLLPLLSSAQEPARADLVTAPGRKMGRALDIILGNKQRGENQARTLVFLIDATPALGQSAFVARFHTAINRHGESLSQTKIGLARVGGRGSLCLPPTLDRQVLGEKLKSIMASPHQDIQNIYAHIRRAASAIAGGPERRELILVSLDNGDAEDKLEGTGKTLTRGGIVFSAITTEAYLADSYWASGAYYQAPRGCRLRGGDSPSLDLPWGWIFQYTIANTATPSGFAQYALNRLAHLTGGRIYLYSPPTKTKHSCTVYGSCPFCTGDHLPAGEAFNQGSVNHLAPMVTSRKDALRTMAADPYYRALFRVWKDGAKAGILRSKPPLQEAGSGFKESKNQSGHWAPLTVSMNFSRQAKKAEKLARSCTRIGKTLEGNIREAATIKNTLPRFRAMADLTRVLLQITRINLLAYAAWCREIAPVILGKDPEDFSFPEAPTYGADRRPSGIGYTGFSLCHGIAPFQKLHLPGGDKFKTELAGLEGMVSSFLDKYSGTPYAMALRISNIARFHFTYPGKYTRVDRKRRNSKTKEDPGTSTPRPTRRPASGAGRPTSGPTSGGR